MKIHEYQAKQIFARYGVTVPKGYPANTPAEAEAAAKKLIDETKIPVDVVKAQIHAGGRGKGGGVKLAKNGPAEARELAEKMLGKALITHQTGPEGQMVRRLYVEQGLDIGRELYLALVLDRDARRVAIMASTEGGMDIEQVARDTPEKIHRLHIDPVVGLAAYQARGIGFALGLDKDQVGKFVKLLASLYDMFVKEDCSICEINPLITTKQGDLVALDGKVNFDDNAEFRHREWKELQDRDEEDPVELEARESGLQYVSLDGNIGCLVNGAGLAMATMDIIQTYGGSPANFLDVGGGATLRRHDEVRRHRGRRHRRHQADGPEGAAGRAPRRHQRRGGPAHARTIGAGDPGGLDHGRWRETHRGSDWSSRLSHGNSRQ